MATIQYPFIGAMDLDTPVEVFKKGFLNDARNVIARGEPGNMRYEDMPGTRSLGIDLPAGTNCSIGGCYDARDNFIYDFNFNSNGNHAIYRVNTITEAVTTLIDAGSVLDFDADFPIHSAYILYGDSTQGNVLYWVNSQGVPCQININQALAGDYGSYQKPYLQVIKQPADIPPAVVYENDNTRTINNLRKQLFVFKTQWEFNNRDKSVWSSWSVVPLPVDAADPNVDGDVTKNSRIAVVIQTGPANVRKIRIAGAVTKATRFGDFFEIDLLDKDALGIPDNDIYIYYFYNDKVYIPLSVPESILLQDKVPKKAGTMILLNGNTPAYGNITEGFDLLSTLGDTAASDDVETVRRTQSKALFYVAQTGDTIGTIGDNIHIIVAGVPLVGDTFSFTTTHNTFSATGSVTPVDILNTLAAQAAIAGYNVVSEDANNLVIQKNGEQLVRSSLVASAAVLGAFDATFAYDWWSRETFALVYFDPEGRTNGAQITTGFTVELTGYTESGGGVPQIPRVSISIYHRPPDWADDYQIVRTRDITKSRQFQWISDRTYKDTVEEQDGYLYAWISIENLNQYIKDKPSAKFLAYDFAPGDRIRFIKLYPSGGSTLPVIETDKDYEIQQQELDPIINGIQFQGQFLKIYLPTTDINFDFGIQTHSPVTDPIDYANYFIELYTPAVSATENLDRYFECSQRYAIGNYGTSTRFHQGMLQNQTPDLTTPATFVFDQGNYYARYRNINAAPEIKFTITEQDNIMSLNQLAMTVDPNFNVTGYTAKDVPPGVFVASVPPPDPDWLINVNDGNTYTFNIRGNIVVQCLNDATPGFRFNITVTDGLGGQNLDVLTDTFLSIQDKVYNITVNKSFTVPAGYKYIYIYLFIAGSTPANSIKVISGDLVFNDAARKFTQLVIDANFSDSFQSAVNSDGRPQVYDINAKEVRFPVLMRYGLNYEIDTNINNSNRFYPQNFDTYNNSYGDIMRFYQWEKELTVFLYRKCGSVGVYARWVKQNEVNQLLTSDTIITPNNINYYQGDYGIGNQVFSLACSGYQRYFADPVKGYLCRLSLDGVQPISDLYKAQSWSGNNLPPYLNNYPYAYGGFAKIVSAFQVNKDRSGDILWFAQPDQYGIYNLIGEGIGFNEQDNMFRSKIDLQPDYVICAENKLYSFFAGQMYIHDNTSAYGTFYGTRHDAQIQLPVRDPDSVNKSFMSLSYAAPYPQYNIDVPKWLAPTMGDISTAEGQVSNLVDEDFVYDNGMYRGDFQRDDNSEGGVNDGEPLQGLWMQLKLSNSSSQFTWISNLYLVYQTSNRNG